MRQQPAARIATILKDVDLWLRRRDPVRTYSRGMLQRLAIGRAIQSVDASLVYVVHYGSEMQRAAEALGLPMAREGYADRAYDDDGNLAPRALPGAVIHSPEAALAQTLRMVCDGEIVSRTGKVLEVEIDTFCVHGDEPTAAGVAARVRQGLEDAGVRVRPISSCAEEPERAAAA